MRGMPKAQIADRVAKMLAIVELGAFADAEPRRLSGGQQQRVALARALVFEPDVLLLDEPLGALDKNLREQMQIEIRRIHRELGVTTIYVTHDQTEAMTMSDRIVVFNGGKVEQVDAPLALYRRPTTPFVAGFVGDNNVLDAVHADGRIELPGIGPIAATVPPGCPIGPLKIAIRPESIRLASTGDAPPAFAVQGVVNYGDSVVLVGALGPVPLKIRLPAADASTVTAGQSLRIEWPAGAVHVIGPASAT